MLCRVWYDFRFLTPTPVSHNFPFSSNPRTITPCFRRTRQTAAMYHWLGQLFFWLFAFSCRGGQNKNKHFKYRVNRFFIGFIRYYYRLSLLCKHRCQQVWVGRLLTIPFHDYYIFDQVTTCICLTSLDCKCLCVKHTDYLITCTVQIIRDFSFQQTNTILNEVGGFYKTHVEFWVLGHAKKPQCFILNYFISYPTCPGQDPHIPAFFPTEWTLSVVTIYYVSVI